MKYLTLLLTLVVITVSCQPKQVTINQIDSESNDTVNIDKSSLLSDYPMIKDSATFIDNLMKDFDIELSEHENSEKHITAFKKVKINNSDKEYFFIEFDHAESSLAAYPWKFQLLLSPEGKPMGKFSGERYDFVEIFPNENPFLLIVIVTAKGNGGHEIYKITADTLENVYEGYYDYEVRTIDAHEDNGIYEPYELNLVVKDFNNDGLNDIAFEGTMIKYSETSPIYTKRIPIKFIFLYDKQSGHFKSKENYVRKYNLDGFLD